MTNVTWANAKSVLLHTAIVFATVFSTTLAATGYSVSKAAIVSGVSAGAAAALHYLAGFIPNATTSENRAAVREATAPPA